MYAAAVRPLWLDRSDKIGKCSVVELLFMGVFSVFQQMFNFIDIEVYDKKQLNYNTSILTMAGTFLHI